MGQWGEMDFEELSHNAVAVVPVQNNKALLIKRIHHWIGLETLSTEILIIKCINWAYLDGKLYFLRWSLLSEP